MRFYKNIHLRGNSILVRGYENGKSFKRVEKYNPTLYVKSNKPSKYKTLEGEDLVPVFPGLPKECNEFIEKYKDVDNFSIYGNEKYIYQYISDNYPEKEVTYDLSKINILTIDIEVASEEGFPDVESSSEEILLITIQDYNTKNIITWGRKPFVNKHQDVEYRYFSTEYNLLNDFLNWWQTEDNTPDIITGWNCSFYDIPYIIRRIEKVIGDGEAKRLSPWENIFQANKYVIGKEQIAYVITGIDQLDFLDLYKKFTYKNQESYKLDYIAEVELGKKKLDHSEYDSFRDFYTKNWELFTEYNIIDVRLVDMLEDKLKLIDLAITMAYDAKVNYSDVFFQVRMWDSIIYNYLKNKDIVIPPNKKNNRSEYEGAYVKEPIPGFYNWVVSFDLTSLYPSLIMQYNISPETMISGRYPGITINKLLNKQIKFENLENKCVCANGSMYDTTKKGIFPELVEKIFLERQQYKKKMLEYETKLEGLKKKKLNNEISNLEYEGLKEKCQKNISKYKNNQMARKIQINSLYGALGNPYFRYYRPSNAEAITLSGQLSIRWIANKMNKYLNDLLKTENFDFVIASDTDSIYLNMKPFVDKFFPNTDKIDSSKIVDFLDNSCSKKIENVIDGYYKELSDYLNAYEHKMKMKREVIAESAVWIVKKHYFMNVWDSEGVRFSKPKLKIVGMEAIKSSTPAICRDMLKESYSIILKGSENEVIKYINECKEKFYSSSVFEIASPRSANNLEKWKSSSKIYEKGTPINVKGALIFNHYVKLMKLDHKYSIIRGGDKIKYVYLKMPNLIRESVISFIQDFPQEFGLNDSIDYDLQFEKTFMNPLRSILDCLGWKSEKVNTLNSLFV